MMRATELTVDDLLIIGIKGTVLALDRYSGVEIWRTKLKGCDFTNLTREGNCIYAAAGGEISCLDLASGNALWTNPLKGMGFGIVTIATAAQTPAGAHRRKQDDEASSATVIATTSS